MFTQLSTIQDRIRREVMPLLGSNLVEMDRSIKRIQYELDSHLAMIAKIKARYQPASSNYITLEEEEKTLRDHTEQIIAAKRNQYEADFTAGKHLRADMIAETFHRKLNRYTALPYETEEDNLLTLSNEINKLDEFFRSVFSAPDMKISPNFILPERIAGVISYCTPIFDFSALLQKLEALVIEHGYNTSRLFVAPPPHELARLKEKFPRYLQLQLVDELQEAKWTMLEAANKVPEIADTVMLIINGPPVIDYLSLHNLKHRPQVWDNFIESTPQIKAAVKKNSSEISLDFITKNPKIILEFIQSNSKIKGDFKSEDGFRILEFIGNKPQETLKFIKNHIHKWQDFIKKNLEWQLNFINENNEAWKIFIKRNNQQSLENHICFIENPTTSAAEIYTTTAVLIQTYITLIEKYGTFLGRTNPTLFGFRKEMEASLERFKERYIAAELGDPNSAAVAGNPAMAAASAPSTQPSTPPRLSQSSSAETPRTPEGAGTGNLMTAFTQLMLQSPQATSSDLAQLTAKDETFPRWFDVCGYLMKKLKPCRRPPNQLDGSFIATRSD